MSKYSARVFIAASRDEVFDLIIDTSRHREFVWGYVDQVSGPKILSQGAEYIWRISIHGTVFRAYSYVSGLERPRLYQERMHIPGLFRLALSETIEEAGGGVNLTVAWRYTPVAWSATGDLAQKLIDGPDTAREGALGTVEGIKRVLETGRGM